ncbi:MAG TPA: choice-of-anchor B family protein [Flavobacteriales bacterium]|nr:choice-of-anchor B family protein [Flavobacteriales bacterium]
MKKALIILMVFIVCNVVLAQDSLKVKLLYHWDDSTVYMYNEVWGFVQNNREYAVIGALEGTYFFDITNPANVAELGFVPGKEGGCVHRDYHDFNGYLYMVADEGASSLQIIDLDYLPDSLALVYDSDSLFTRSHNIFIDSSTARLYTCGGDQNNGLRVFSLANPLNPLELVNFAAAAGYVHDVYVRDDTAYVHGGGGFFIYDLTDVVNPQLVGSLTSYPTKGYNHSGWLSLDEMIYCFADENTNTDIKICDVSDFGNITVLDTVNSGGDTNAIPHNLIIKNGFLYASYYQDGLWIYDISDPANTSVVGYYDTHPAIATGYGAWGVYPLLPSGVVLVSDMANGLFVFDVTDAITAVDPTGSEKDLMRVHPNPFTSQIYVELPHFITEGKIEVSLIDLQGRIVTHRLITNNGQKKFDLDTRFLTPGIYFLKVASDEGTHVQKITKAGRITHE